MYIACPSCETRYQVPNGVLNAEGRKVKCAVCEHSWLATPEPDAGNATGPPSNESIAVSAPDHDDFAFGEDITGGEMDDGAGDAAAFEGGPDDIADWGNDFEEAAAHVEEDQAQSWQDLANADPSPAKQRIVIKRKRKNPHALTALSGIAAAMLIVSLVWFRENVVRIYPQANTVYASLGLKVNLRGLEFDNVEIKHVAEGGLEVLKITGEIINVRDYAVVLPALRFALNDMRRAEVFSWTTALSDAFVRPGARLPFETELIAPPPEGQAIEVRFIDRDATIAGLEG